VSQARQFTARARQQLDEAQRALPGAKHGVEEAEAEHKKLVVDDKWYPGKVLGGKEKAADKKAAADAKLKAATDALRAAEQRAAQLAAQLQEAQKQQAAWQGKVSIAGLRCLGEPQGWRWQTSLAPGTCCSRSLRPGPAPLTACRACCLVCLQEGELSAARRDLESLVERMFAAPAWHASRRMVELAEASRSLEAQAAEVGR
jgi:hypothetical protein